MKLLNEALQKSLAQNEAMQSQIMDMTERLVALLQPVTRQVYAPSIQQLAPSVVLDRETKTRGNAGTATTIDAIRTWTGIITALDMLSGACQVALDEIMPGNCVPALVTDPYVSRPNNPYVSAMADTMPLRFRAKAERDINGNIIRLYISDIAPD